MSTANRGDSPPLTREMNRDLITEQVLERSRFTTAEQVRKLASLANAERQFGREYHGRFVIELLQNAADAWRKVAEPNQRSKVRIVLGGGPSLIVANQGEFLSANTIIRSLGHIGASTKPHGEAIGHKGIGFKSVLEMTLSPEIYSGFQNGEFSVAVRFDPDRALQTIRSESPHWDDFLADVVGLSEDPLEPIPVLQFPFLIAEVPDEVRALARDGFTTIVRLRFDPAYSERLHFDSKGWEDATRRALNDVTDEIVLLLDMFDEVILDDQLRSEVVAITQSVEGQPRLLNGQVRVNQLVMRRNDGVSSRWRVYREALDKGPVLEAEIAVGIPLTHSDTTPLQIDSPTASAPFHLFFPTRIASGTPFLLHGYFEVAAGRGNFYGGSEHRNRFLLERLSGLVAQAVADAAISDVYLASLAHLLGQAPAPEDPLANWFREKTLDALDDVAWVPTQANSEAPPLVRPTETLAFRPGSLTRRLANTFEPGYVWTSTRAAAVDDAVDDIGLEFLADRRALDKTRPPALWATIATLFKPGELAPWPKGQEDPGFVALLELLALLDATDRPTTRSLTGNLRGNPSARLIPSVAPDGARVLIPPPASAEPGQTERTHLVLARLREREAGELVPPGDLRVSFIADQLLDARLLAGPGSLLSVQEYVVDNILDRLEGLALDAAGGRAVVDFIWRLLVREKRSAFGLQRSLPELSEFDPGRFFWFRPGRAEGGEADRQRRERGLASLPLPSRAGPWKSASLLAFGEDWGQWLQSGALGPRTAAMRQRASAYRDLEHLAPSPESLLAAPNQIMAILADIPLWEEGWSDELVEDHRRNIVRHAFLMRLGVWEVPPVEIFLDRRDRSDNRIPWPGPLRDQLIAWVAAHGGWVFDYPTYQHDNVTVGEDYRLDWSFEGRDPERLARSISRGSRLYERLAALFAFCPGCHNHRTRYKTTQDNAFPSRLALQLRHEPWLPCARDGRDILQPLSPTVAWWDPSPPERAGMQQSPLRYLPIVRQGTPLSESLRQLADLPQLTTATMERTRRLLVDLRDQFRAHTLDPDPARSGLAKQAFVGLHRLAYRRLADIALVSPGLARNVIGEIRVLCDIGNALDYKPAGESRHDDGRFAAYRRYFSGKIPFVIIARDQEVVAKRLGIAPFEVEFVRRDSGKGVDVTDEVTYLVADRAVEFLAIVVNHSLGTQTLELGSEQFHERSRRLLKLRVVHVEQLVLDAAVVGSEARTSIGDQADIDVFLEGPTSAQPVLYQSLRGDGWKDGLRRKLAPNIAAVLENASYAATFALFLQQVTDADREEFLLELGITGEDVDAVRSALGVLSEADRLGFQRWFSAILDTVGDALNDVIDQDITSALIAAGLHAQIAHRLVEIGGGNDVRSDTGPDSALRLLVDSGVSLARLNAALVARGDAGLLIRNASDRLRDWKARYGRRVAAALATKVGDVQAKARVEAWTADAGLRFVLDPAQVAVLSPIVEDLRLVGLDPDPQALASDDPVAEIARLAGCADAAELDRRVLLLFDAEERDRILRGLARDWRREIRLIGVLLRATPHEPRSVTRLHGEEVEGLLPANADCPTALRPSLTMLFSGAPGLEEAITDLLVDQVTANPPDRRMLAQVLRDHGLDPAPLADIERVLAAPARTEVRRVRSQIDQLTSQGVQIAPPENRKAPSPTASRRSSIVRTIHVTSRESSRRQLGEEGERWSLAAVIQPLLDPQVRKRALPELVKLLRRFAGDPVARALGHADALMAADLDDEELIDELTGLLHVALYSDDFGFDLLGWLAPAVGAEPTAMCLEAKSSADGSFHFSAGEWAQASQLRDDGLGHQYAILVVRRGSGPVPERLDLLVDPVTQCDHGLLFKRDDGYVITY
ncbi:MAG: hypothetical protein M3082_21495 [Candidatus Dormibacteraeota bacterium]|nr:hypothetical protein [Candidatus Dormibacteraeota bacterium]